MARTHGKASILDRFWAKVQIGGPDECWLWTGEPSPGGYGRFGIGRNDGKNIVIQAHSFALAVSLGVNVDYVLHRCDIGMCCNPAHLYQGDHAQNMADMVERGRAARQCGEANPLVRLTWDQVREIRARAGLATQRELADEYGVSHANIGYIQRGQTWRAA